MPTPNEAFAGARDRIDRLRVDLAQSTGREVALIETHISWVLLTGEEAYKFKKPLRLPFLDFSTAERRRYFCEEELRLNRRLAPALYLGVVDVFESPRGPRLGAGGPVVDTGIRMKQFAQGALWSERLRSDALLPSHVDMFAERLAQFHRDAPAADQESKFGSQATIADGVRRLLQSLEVWANADAPWPALRRWIERQLVLLAPFLHERRESGHVRECHGDLHLSNVLQLESGPAAFDGIEFDPAMRWIDVVDDVAFLVMDLIAHHRSDLAFRFLNGYLEHTGDYAGLAALRFYLVCRALVRAEVAFVRESQGLAPKRGCGRAEYLALAARLSHGADPRLALMHGLPGSGKSFMARAIAESAGAIRIRSDVERKRLFRSDAGRAVGGGLHGGEASEQTYGRLHDLARAALRGGWPVIIDAAFLDKAERHCFEALARSYPVPLAIYDCTAPTPVMRKRIERRLADGSDASDADLTVLERLDKVSDPLEPDELARVIAVDSERPEPPARLAQRWLDLPLDERART